MPEVVIPPVFLVLPPKPNPPVRLETPALIPLVGPAPILFVFPVGGYKLINQQFYFILYIIHRNIARYIMIITIVLIQI